MAVIFFGVFMRHDIGHMYIDSEVGCFEFYPTFKNIRNVCEPEELVDAFANINGVIQSKIEVSLMMGFGELSNIYKRTLYQWCALIMQSCCDDDITPLIGRIKWERSAKHFQLGILPLEHMVAFSKILLKHGVIGINTGKPGSSEKCSEVDVYDFVRIAMSHLDMTMEHAENLTKTEFDKIMAVKFPEQKSSNNNSPSDEQYEEAMAFLDKIEANRNNKK